MDRYDKELMAQALKKRNRRQNIDSAKFEALIDNFKLLLSPFPHERLLRQIKRDATAVHEKSFMPAFLRKPLIVSGVFSLVLVLAGLYYFVFFASFEPDSIKTKVARSEDTEQNIVLNTAQVSLQQIPKNEHCTSRQLLERWALEKDAALVAYIDDENMIVSVGKKGTVDALFSSGKTWTYELGSSVTAPLVWNTEAIYFATSNSKISALYKHSGMLIWSRSIDGRVLFGGGMAHHAGTLYAGTSNGSVYAFNASGEIKWNKKFDSGIFVPPVVTGKELVVATNDGKVLQMKTYDGSVVSSIPVGRVSGMSLGKDGTLYLSTQDGKVICYNYEKKVELWRYSTNTRLAQSPIVHRNGVFAFSSSGDVHYIDHTGRLLWKSALGGPINVHPSIRKGDLFILAGKAMYVIDTKDGDVKWSYVMDSIATTSAVIAENNIVLGTQSDGMLILRRN